MSTFDALAQDLAGAAKQFATRFMPPNQPVDAARQLAVDLGFRDPDVIQPLIQRAWDDAARGMLGELKQLSLATDPKSLAAMDTKWRRILDLLQTILRTPGEGLNAADSVGQALQQHLPTRLLSLIVYDFVEASHPRIFGAFTLLGILSRRRMPEVQHPQLDPDAVVRVFELSRLVEAVTSPHKTFLTVLRWGTDEFEDRAVVDGLGKLLAAAGVPVDVVTKDDTFPPDEERRFFPALGGAVRPAARRVLTTGGGPAIGALVGLHRHGLGLHAVNPVALSANGLPMSQVPQGAILQLAPSGTDGKGPPVPRLVTPA